MQKKFLTNLSLLVFLNLLIKPFWVLAIDRGVQNAVGSDEYGFYFSLFNFSFLLNILLDLGITTYNNRNIAQNQDQLQDQFSKIVSLKAILATIYAVVTLAAGSVIGYSSEQMGLLYIMVFNQFLMSFVLYLRSNLSGLHLFKTDSLLSVLDRSIMIIICAYLLWGMGSSSIFQIEWFVYAQTVAYAIAALTALILVVAKARFKAIQWDFAFYKSIITKSFPFAVMILLMSFYNRIDSVMLERMLPDGFEQAGIYAQGYRLLDASNMMAYLFAVLLLPIFSRMLSTSNGGGKEEILKLLGLSYSLLIVPAIIVAAAAYSYQSEIIKLLYTETTESSSTVLGLLMMCFVAISTTYVFGTLLTANGNLTSLNIMALIGILLNIGLNILLIPQLKAEGAAIASLSTQVTTTLIQVFLVQYFFKFTVNYKFIGKLILFGLASFAIGHFSIGVFSNWKYDAFMMVLATTTLAFALRLVKAQSIINVLKYKS